MYENIKKLHILFLQYTHNISLYPFSTRFNQTKEQHKTNNTRHKSYLCKHVTPIKFYI